MANDHRPNTIFNFYYYVADRWGGWPFLVTRFIGSVAGFRWTAESVFVWQVVWISIGVLIFARLTRRDQFVAAVAYLIALCLHRESRYLMFELSQVYPWQSTACLLGWWTLRRLFDDQLQSARSTPAWTISGWFFLVLVFSFLAIWSSVASALFLGFLLCLEAVRASAKGWLGRSLRRVLMTCAVGGTAIAAGFFMERFLKLSYRDFSLKTYGDDFATRFGLDTGHLAENLGKQLLLVGELSWWPLYVVPTLAVLTFAYVFVYAMVRKNSDLRQRLQAAIADDTTILALGAYGIAALNFALTVAVSHVRLHFYDDRYLTLTHLFGPISGLLTAYLLLAAAVVRWRASAYVRHAVVVVAVLFLTIRFPHAGQSQSYQMSKTTALTLASRAPRTVLMGDYWDTYVFSALQGGAAMIPVPLEGRVTRTPWTRSQVRHSNQVIVAYKRAAWGAPVTPAPTLQEYGCALRLVDPHWYETSEYLFAQYINETRPVGRGGLQ
jgi:hypothetical protein